MYRYQMMLFEATYCALIIGSGDLTGRSTRPWQSARYTMPNILIVLRDLQAQTQNAMYSHYTASGCVFVGRSELNLDTTTESVVIIRYIGRLQSFP